VKATYDGVMRFPWSLTKISTLPFCITPTQLHTS
jgi:hypothetical protein